MLKPVTDETFHDEIRENTNPCVVYFTGSWCQPCQTFSPIFETMAKRMKGNVRFFKANMDDIEKTALELNIRSLPSLVLFSDGMVRDVHTGTMTIGDMRLWIQESI